MTYFFSTMVNIMDDDIWRIQDHLFHLYNIKMDDACR